MATYFPLPDPPPGVAYAITAGSRIFNALWETAQEKSAAFDVRMNDATAAVPSSSNIGTAPTVGAVTTPTVPIPPPAMSAGEVQALFDTNAEAIKQLLVDAYSNYLATYYPGSAYLTSAETWINNVLTNGGTGVNPIVEQQIWHRERGRTLQELERAEDELMTTWAGRGYPLPPGALTGSVLRVRQDADGKIGESSRAQAIRVFEIEIEQSRFAVGQALALRQQAVSSAGEYMRSLVLGPQVGAQLATSLAETQASFARVTTEYYRSLIAASEIPLRVATTNAELSMRTKELAGRLDNDLVSKRVEAAIAAAQLYSTQTAGAFNALNAQAGMSSSDSVSTSL